MAPDPANAGFFFAGLPRFAETSYIVITLSHLSRTHMPEVIIRSIEAPIAVGSIFCIGRNYIRHIEELENEVNAEPVLFLKPAASLITEGQAIELPTYSNDVHHETELVLLVGRKGRHITEEHALEYLAGAGIGLDLTARDTQQKLKDKGLPWTLAKGFETAACVSDFLPLSMLPPLDNLHFTLHVNDEPRQEGDTSLMIFSVPRIISFISSMVTLYPGDLIFTGTPHGVAPILKGDVLDLRLGDTLRATFRVHAEVTE
jgi:2-keto-4-pentenoate hydratase/2-oxohepta-3-ene-1,7-dioic acid hydratase in catechol pathway